jgi:hypothetical protein
VQACLGQFPGGLLAAHAQADHHHVGVLGFHALLLIVGLAAMLLSPFPAAAAQQEAVCSG